MSRSSFRRAARSFSRGGEQPLGPEHDVLDDRQALGQRKVLVHHADAGRERRAGRARRQGVELPSGPATAIVPSSAT